MSAEAAVINAMSNLYFMIFFFVGVFILGGIMVGLRRTQRYRKELSDLYVAGRIRQFAKKDSIDLGDEYQAYKKWLRKKLSAERDVDSVVAMDLKDRIAEDVGKKSTEGTTQQ